MSFADRYGPWALIAGASEGIGAAFARALAQRRLNLVLVARRPEQLQTTSRQLQRDFDVETTALALDLAVPEAADQIEDAVAALEVGLLVYNAALSQVGPFCDADIDALEQALRVNCRAPLRLTHHLARHMVQRRRGGIVLMSSLSGFQGFPYIATYAATKAFNIVLAEALWDELRDCGVDVLACCAGATMTPGYAANQPERLPWLAPRVLSPDEVVSEALKALGRKPSIIPGTGNRFARFVTNHLMSRRKAVRMMGQAGRELYRLSSGRRGNNG